MLKKRKDFYCLYRNCLGDKKQIILLAHRSGVISLDFLFDKAVSLDIEVLFSPEGGTQRDMDFFLSEFLKRRSIDFIWTLGLDEYNQEILKIDQASQIYSLFERFGRRYPDQNKERSLKDIFLKI